MELLSEFLIIPTNIYNFIISLNGLRNAFAHSFFPENRRREKATYKKKKIHNIETLREYKEDYDKATEFLMEKAWGIKSGD